jgi:Polyketide cyclase / dehydrase and lipid transport
MAIRTALIALTLFAAAPAFAQAPTPAPANPPAPVAIANPHYESVVMEVNVAKPAAEVWARIGRYCDIGEWMAGTPCQITAGKDGELGAVRVLRGTTIEILVAKTPLSYTYAQPVRVGVPYNVYHGTLEARPVDAKSSKLVYSLFWDNSMLADDAAREKDVAARRDRFTGLLNVMKAMVESGKARP